jgi:hypothetical protein
MRHLHATPQTHAPGRYRQGQSSTTWRPHHFQCPRTTVAPSHPVSVASSRSVGRPLARHLRMRSLAYPSTEYRCIHGVSPYQPAAPLMPPSALPSPAFVACVSLVRAHLLASQIILLSAVSPKHTVPSPQPTNAHTLTTGHAARPCCSAIGAVHPACTQPAAYYCGHGPDLRPQQRPPCTPAVWRPAVCA